MWSPLYHVIIITCLESNHNRKMEETSLFSVFFSIPRYNCYGNGGFSTSRQRNRVAISGSQVKRWSVSNTISPPSKFYLLILTIATNNKRPLHKKWSFIKSATIYPPRPFPTKYFRRMGLTAVFGTSIGENTPSASLLLRAFTSRTDVLFSSRARRA